jgi:hypothetical protein
MEGPTRLVVSINCIRGYELIAPLLPPVETFLQRRRIMGELLPSKQRGGCLMCVRAGYITNTICANCSYRHIEETERLTRVMFYYKEALTKWLPSEICREVFLYALALS